MGWWRLRRGTGALLVLVASAGPGCGRMHVGPDPEVTQGREVAEETEIPPSGYADWPDDTLPLVTVDLERTPPARPTPSEEDTSAEPTPPAEPAHAD